MEMQDRIESSDEEKSGIDQELNEEDGTENSPGLHNNGYQRSLTETDDIMNAVTSSSSSSSGCNYSRLKNIKRPIQIMLLLVVLSSLF